MKPSLYKAYTKKAVASKNYHFQKNMSEITHAPEEDWIDFNFSDPLQFPDVLINMENKPDAPRKNYATRPFQQQIIKEILNFYSGTAQILRLYTDERRPGMSTALLEATGQLFEQQENTKFSILVITPSERTSDSVRDHFEHMFPSNPWSIDICSIGYVKGMRISRFYHNLIIIDDAFFVGETEIDRLSKKTRVIVLQTGVKQIRKTWRIDTTPRAFELVHFPLVDPPIEVRTMQTVINPPDSDIEFLGVTPHFAIAWVGGLPFRIEETNFGNHIFENTMEEVD